MIRRTLLSLSYVAFLAVSTSVYANAQDANDAAMAEALQTLDASLPGTLINNPYDIKWNTEGSDFRQSIVKSEGAPGGMAYSVTIKKTKANIWDTAIRIPMTTDIAKGDVILVSFWARAAKLRKGKDTGIILAGLQRNTEPYDSIAEETFEPGMEWKLYSLAGKANRDYSADKTNMNFNLAKAKQTLEFGQFYIMNLGPNGDASKYMKD